MAGIRFASTPRETAQAKSVQTIYSTGFDDLAGWGVVEADRIGPKGKSQAYYRAFNVAVNNISEAVCKKGKKTRYSSGRVQAGLAVPAGSNFEAEFSALMPATGVRPVAAPRSRSPRTPAARASLPT